MTARRSTPLMIGTALLAAVMLLAACAAPSGSTSSSGGNTAPISVEVTPTLVQATASPTPTPQASPSPANAASETLSVPTMPAVTETADPAAVTPSPAAIPPDTLPLRGSFDIYISAPDEQGTQLLRWTSTSTGEAATEVRLRGDDGDVVRAGQYVYFHAPGTREPYRINTAGAIQPVSFARPPAGSAYFQLLPSATGQFLAWASVGPDGVFTISTAGSDGTNVRQVGGDTLLPGESLRLVRVSNDGRRVFYERRPEGITHETVFNGRYDLYMLDAQTQQVAHLPGEPACGESLVCDAHVSADGAFLIRTLPPSVWIQPIVVTNLVSSVVLTRFAPVSPPSGSIVDLGYPFLTPGGELIYVETFGPPTLERYQLVWANIVTGEQRVIADLGHEKHRPLGWASDGMTLLTAREPDQYDTWQINVETGAMRQIASMLFLGHVEEPPPTP